MMHRVVTRAGNAMRTFAKFHNHLLSSRLALSHLIEALPGHCKLREGSLPALPMLYPTASQPPEGGQWVGGGVLGAQTNEPDVAAV